MFFRGSKIEHYLEPCGRLEWILGLADEAPETSVTAMFSPSLYCLERPTYSDLARIVAIQPLGTEPVIRNCKMNSLDSLQLGAHYTFDGLLRYPIRNEPPVGNGQRHIRRLDLNPARGSLYITGGRYDLPPRLQKAARLHAALPDGVTFYAFSVPESEGMLTVLLPCSEIFRSCYGHFGQYLAGVHNPARPRPFVESGYAFNSIADGKHRRFIGANRRMQREEPQQIIPRALAHGSAGRPRPILIRPPHDGNVVLAGSGYSYFDEQGEVLFIVSGLSIEKPVLARLP